MEGFRERLDCATPALATPLESGSIGPLASQQGASLGLGCGNPTLIRSDVVVY